MITLKSQVRTALLYFLIVALLGFFLRLFFVVPIPASFRYVVHAHSHIALLGWVYLALMALIYKLYIYKSRSSTYNWIYWITQLSLIGMLISFPFTGYALWSIIFSTLFLLVSYWMSWFILKKSGAAEKKRHSFKFIRSSLWYLIISSLGPWAVGIVMASLGKASIWYKLSIYFYLHFQYNGWFIFALLGVFLYFLEEANRLPRLSTIKTFYRLLHAGVILSLCLSALWLDPHWSWYLIGGSGAVIQLWAFILLVKGVSKSGLAEKTTRRRIYLILLLLLFLKLIAQVFSAIPAIAEMGFNYPDFIIGYLHWIFLGVISFSLFLFLNKARLLRLPPYFLLFYLVVFFASEILIFYKAMGLKFRFLLIDHFYLILSLVSGLFFLLILWLLVFNFIKRRSLPLSEN